MQGLALLVEYLVRSNFLSRLLEQVGDAKQLPLVVEVPLDACTSLLTFRTAQILLKLRPAHGIVSNSNAPLSANALTAATESSKRCARHCQRLHA